MFLSSLWDGIYVEPNGSNALTIIVTGLQKPSLMAQELKSHL